LIKLTDEEKHLILELRNIEHGEICVKVQDFKVVTGYTTRKWTKQDISWSGKKVKKTLDLSLA